MCTGYGRREQTWSQTEASLTVGYRDAHTRVGMAQGVRTPLAERSDDQLGALVAQGDEQAFAELYQRYFRGLYDFTLRTLRDRDAATDVVQSTFVKAWTALRSPKGVENVKAWLYAVARNLAIDELRRRQRIAPKSGEAEEDPIYTIVDESRLSDPSVAAHDQELVDLVWESAAALSPSEYSLLDMHLRQGLDADEISEALGVAKGAVYTRLTRLRDSLDEAVTSSVLMKQARDRCEDLDALLTRMNATELTRDVKKAITEHAKDCEICGEVKRRLITPAELFAGLTLVPIPAGLMEAIWHGISTELGFAGAAAAGHAVAGKSAATHTVKHSRHATKVKAATALGTLGAVAVVGALLFPRGGAVKDPSDVHSTSNRIGVAAVSPDRADGLDAAQGRGRVLRQLDERRRRRAGRGRRPARHGRRCDQPGARARPLVVQPADEGSRRLDAHRPRRAVRDRRLDDPGGAHPDVGLQPGLAERIGRGRRQRRERERPRQRWDAAPAGSARDRHLAAGRLRIVVGRRIRIRRLRLRLERRRRRRRALGEPGRRRHAHASGAGRRHRRDDDHHDDADDHDAGSARRAGDARHARAHVADHQHDVDDHDADHHDDADHDRALTADGQAGSARPVHPAGRDRDRGRGRIQHHHA